MNSKCIFGVLLWAAWLAAPPVRGFAQNISQPYPDGLSSSPKGGAAFVSTNSMEVLDDKRTLSNGDRVSYRVIEEQLEPRPLLVTDSGEMEVPLIGRVHAAGKTCRQLAVEIKKWLEKDYFFRATVIIGLDVASSKTLGLVYVMGAVRNQGAMEIPPEGTFTVSKAILRAGGFTDFANQRKVKLVRKRGEQKETSILDVKETLQGGETEDPVLRVDDVVIVSENRLNF